MPVELWLFLAQLALARLANNVARECRDRGTQTVVKRQVCVMGFSLLVNRPTEWLERPAYPEQSAKEEEGETYHTINYTYTLSCCGH